MVTMINNNTKRANSELVEREKLSKRTGVGPGGIAFRDISRSGVE